MASVGQVQAWKRVAVELGFSVEAPCDVTLTDGTHVKATAHLKDFGGRNGMIVDPVWAILKPHAQALEASGYGYSCVTLDQSSDRASIIEVLSDWTWTGVGPAPAWLPK